MPHLSCCAGVSPPKTGTDMSIQDNPSYSAVQRRLDMETKPAYEQIIGEHNNNILCQLYLFPYKINLMSYVCYTCQ